MTEMKRGTRRVGGRTPEGRLFGLVLGTVFGLFLLLACSSIDCPVQNTIAVNYGFYTGDGEAVSLLDTVDIWSKRADGTDTILFNRGVNVSTVSLPIGYSNNFPLFDVPAKL